MELTQAGSGGLAELLVLPQNISGSAMLEGGAVLRYAVNDKGSQSIFEAAFDVRDGNWTPAWDANAKHKGGLVFQSFTYK